MSESRFEDLLKKKADNYKASAPEGMFQEILAQTQSASSKAISSKSLASKVRDKVSQIGRHNIVKATIGIACITGTSVIINQQLQQEETTQEIVEPDVITESNSEDAYHVSPNRRTTEIKQKSSSQDQLIPSSNTNSYEASTKKGKEENINRQLHTKESITAPIDTNNYTDTDNKERKEKLDHINTKEMYILDHNVKDSFDIKAISDSSKTKNRTHKIEIMTSVSYGKSFLIEDYSNNDSYKSKYCAAGVYLYYRLNHNLKLVGGADLQYLNIKSNYYNNDEIDGTIDRKIKLIHFKGGINYQLLKQNRWSLEAEAKIGASYKLSHINYLDGKYFDYTFTNDQTSLYRWSPSVDLTIYTKYQISNHFDLGIAIQGSFHKILAQSNVINTGGMITLSYRL